LVTSGVTFGLPYCLLPSRSPPIQDAKRMGPASSGNRFPKLGKHGASNLCK
jgi:hypothetical protein